MEVLIHKLIDSSLAQEILECLQSAPISSWVDGRKTAGSHAAISKNNLQLDRDSIVSKKQSQRIIEKIYSDTLVKSFTLPRRLHSLMFSKSTTGMGYGTHVDNAYMSTGRSDLSFTLFLSDPESYEGGALNIQSLQDDKRVRLPSGHIAIYPSTSLHSVEEVSSGERIVCVGWIESYVKSNEDRINLFTLDSGARGLLAKYGRSEELDLVFQSYANLLRRLGN